MSEECVWGAVETSCASVEPFVELSGLTILIHKAWAVFVLSMDKKKK